MADPRELLRTAYGGVAELLGGVAVDGDGWTPTGCRGWTVADLGYHLLGDARRALLALCSPTDRRPDSDSVRYWRARALS